VYIFLNGIIIASSFNIYFVRQSIGEVFLSEEVELSLVKVCKNILDRYEIHFVEIVVDENHVYFLIQSVSKIFVEIAFRMVKVSLQKKFSDCMHKLKVSCGW
jgi:hypothetical protein